MRGRLPPLPRAVIGVGIAAVKGALVAADVVLAATLWAINAWRRRGECAVPKAR